MGAMAHSQPVNNTVTGSSNSAQVNDTQQEVHWAADVACPNEPDTEAQDDGTGIGPNTQACIGCIGQHQVGKS